MSKLTDAQVESFSPPPVRSHHPTTSPSSKRRPPRSPGCTELGDGVVYRVARETQRRYWDPH